MANSRCMHMMSGDIRSLANSCAWHAGSEWSIYKTALGLAAVHHGFCYLEAIAKLAEFDGFVLELPVVLYEVAVGRAQYKSPGNCRFGIDKDSIHADFFHHIPKVLAQCK